MFSCLTVNDRSVVEFELCQAWVDRRRQLVWCPRLGGSSEYSPGNFDDLSLRDTGSELDYSPLPDYDSLPVHLTNLADVRFHAKRALLLWAREAEVSLFAKAQLRVSPPVSWSMRRFATLSVAIVGLVALGADTAGTSTFAPADGR
jgi:hypothetical protein